MKYAIALFMAVLAAPAASQTIEAGHAKWDNFPRLNRDVYALPIQLLTASVENILKARRCDIKGQSADHFDISVPYVAQVDDKGALSRIVVKDVGCPDLEALIGAAVIKMANEGAIRLPAKAGWYSDTISFAQQ